MDRSVRKLPNPTATAFQAERRQAVRQKLHTPIFARLNGPHSGVSVDLSELLDLNLQGFAVQAGQRLDAHRAVAIALDLPETSRIIHASGHVVWSSDSGRSGIKFSNLAPESSQALKEWLFVNLLVACSNHAARSPQPATPDAQNLDAQNPAAQILPRPGVPNATTSVAPPVVSTIPTRAADTQASIAALRRDVLALGDNFDAILDLIAARVLTLTNATGAAVAYLSDDTMIWRARAGHPAPPLTAPVETRSGLSGECIRTGRLVRCDDTQDDPRIDPALGRQLGIGTLLALPILSDFRVVGLLEAFSSSPQTFAHADAKTLESLISLIPKPVPGAAPPQHDPPKPPRPDYERPAVAPAGSAPNRPVARPQVAFPQAAPQIFHPIAPEPTRAQPEDVDSPPSNSSRFLYRSLLGLALMVAIVAVGYVFGPAIEGHWIRSPQASARPAPAAGATVATAPTAATVIAPTATRPQAKSLADLQMLAGNGDPEAAWQLGLRYHNGEDIPQNDALAMQWFERAAEQGHVIAQGTVGAYYWAGRGVPQDLSKAYLWSAIATSQGDEISKSRMEGLASQMTRRQVSAARDQAEQWMHIHTHPNETQLPRN